MEISVCVAGDLILLSLDNDSFEFIPFLPFIEDVGSVSVSSLGPPLAPPPMPESLSWVKAFRCLTNYKYVCSSLQLFFVYFQGGEASSM